MNKTLHLEIITPEKKYFEGDVEMLVISAIDGEMGILPGMATTVTELQPGEMRYFYDKEWHYAYASDGFVEVTPAGVVVLSQEAENPEDIEEKRAIAEIQRSQEIMRQKRSLQEYRLSKASLARAFGRLQVKNRHGMDV